MRNYCLAALLLIVTACSDDQPPKDHVFEVGKQDIYDWYINYDQAATALPGTDEQREWDLDFDGQNDLILSRVDSGTLKKIALFTQANGDWQIASQSFKDSIFACTAANKIGYFNKLHPYRCTPIIDSLSNYVIICDLPVLGQAFTSWPEDSNWSDSTMLQYEFFSENQKSYQYLKAPDHPSKPGSYYILFQRETPNTKRKAWMRISPIFKDGQLSSLNIHELAIQAANRQ